jgi:hypothetical protein
MKPAALVLFRLHDCTNECSIKIDKVCSIFSVRCFNYCIVMMIFTFNSGVGMTAGPLSYPSVKALAGRCREVPAVMRAFAALSLLFSLFYPHR